MSETGLTGISGRESTGDADLEHSSPAGCRDGSDEATLIGAGAMSGHGLNGREPDSARNDPVASMQSAFDVTEIKTCKAFEKFLRDAGFPKAFAVAVTNHGFKAAAGLRDADDAADHLDTFADRLKANTDRLRNPKGD